MADSLKLLRIKEAAELLGINPATLRKWDKKGKSTAVKISKRGGRRYKISVKIGLGSFNTLQN